ncbi:MAG: hypothetical protein IBX62_04220 [Coriobacteriia bacterium]|nr:hypothetical protein [Coriobacteriia bacterium]
MTRVYDYDRWMAERGRMLPLIARLAGQPRATRRRPRSPEESRMLARAALDAIRRREREGRLRRLGPRRYELRN